MGLFAIDLVYDESILSIWSWQWSENNNRNWELTGDAWRPLEDRQISVAPQRSIIVPSRNMLSSDSTWKKESQKH